MTTRLSVVVVRFAGGDAIGATLAALAPQLQPGRDEVVVVHDGREPIPDREAASAGTVRWVQGAPGASPAELRSLGVHAARGVFVACTEDHCAPAADWCTRLLAALEGGAPVVGGAITLGHPATPVAWAAYLLDYSRYMPPLAAGGASYLSDCNVAYRREALEAVHDAWREAFHETTVHWALQRRGVVLLLDPSMLVAQRRDVSIGRYLAERREHGATFARTRMAGASAWQRRRFALQTHLLAPVLVLRVVRRLALRGDVGRVPAAAWGALWRAAAAWGRGERDGYLAPGGGE